MLIKHTHAVSKPASAHCKKYWTKYLPKKYAKLLENINKSWKHIEVLWTRLRYTYIHITVFRDFNLLLSKLIVLEASESADYPNAMWNFG